MKGLGLLVFIALCGLVYSKPEKYTTKYDNVDIDSIIHNDRLLKNYVDCLLGTRKCTKDGEELKKHIPSALTNKCADCSMKQMDGSRKIIHYLIKEKRPWWNELQKKYDPSNSYVVAYADDLKKEGITL